MAATPSSMLPLGTPLPRFELLDTISGNHIGSGSLADSLAVVAFICNHCPFVIHIKQALSRFGAECVEKGVKMVAISANDVSTHPMDGPEHMAQDAARHAYSFPYLYDETQGVARAFDARCTPEFYVFDRSGKLAYRGQFDASRPSNTVAVSGSDVRAAVEALLAGGVPNPEQKPSIGCNIKWKPGNTPS